MKTIEVRKSTSDDGPRLKEIRLLSLRDEPDAYGSTFDEAVLYSDDQWATMASERNYFLALANDDPVGMSSGGLFPPFPGARWLYGMFVKKEHRGTGVAVDLVRAVANWARQDGSDTLGLHVTRSLGRARAFYSKIGFNDVGTPSPMDRDARLLLMTMTTDLRTNEHV